MSGFEALAVVGLMALVLLVAGVPLAFTFALAGSVGIALTFTIDQTMNLLKLLPHRTVSNYLLSAVPMFLLFGYLAEVTGIAHGSYVAARKWFGTLPGGIGIATTVAAGMFGAASGSTVSATALFGRMSVPELRSAGYSKEAAIGCVAGAGLLAATIPPSIPLLIYGFLTRQSVIKLFAAGIVPGVLQVFLFSLTIMLMARFGKGIGPAEPAVSWSERFLSIGGIWPIALVSLAILGSIYAGIATVTESAAFGLFCALLIMLVRKQLTFESLKDGAFRTVGTLVMVLAILIGGLIFSTFLVVSGVASDLGEAVGNLPIPAWGVIVLFILFYVVLGMFVDGLSMQVITVPVLAPIVVSLGYDLIWFGVLTTVMIEFGAITPPVGINVFVLKAQIPDATLEECFRGVIPFFFSIAVLIALLVGFPQIALWLPRFVGR